MAEWAMVVVVVVMMGDGHRWCFGDGWVVQIRRQASSSVRGLGT